MPLATLDLTGMDIDEVARSFSVLKAKYGAGYQDGVLVGHAGGLHSWKLSAGVLTDSSSYNDLISSVPTFQYYWDFFQARMAEGNGPFILPFRGDSYHAGFVDTGISMEMFTIDLFGGGVELEQRRVVGSSYATNGSISGS